MQDTDGQLSPDELDAMLQMSRGVDVSKLDLDGDGYVTHDEMVRSMIEAQSAADV